MKIELILVKEWLVSHEVLATASKTIVLVVILEQMWKALRLTLTMRMEPSEVGDSRGSGCFVAVAVTRGGEAVSKGGSSGSGLATGVEGPASRGDGTGAAAGVVRSGVRTGRGTGKAAKPTVRSEPTVMRGASSRVGERDDVAGVVREDGSDNLARIGGYDLAAGVILVVVKFELGSVLLVLKVVLVQDPVKHPNVLSVLLHPWYISSW
ncbi:hypothetical protein PC117_g10051 [Phytophthora cactorum]|uniref:Uncharacterized protein n=1 Tax=Phytophthora cactorum TaxID=29920 RepID=A0A8T1DMQ6_9STRA|nr:hypothetical protein PC117_g10051 [Phytophthora cactorum]